MAWIYDTPSSDSQPVVLSKFEKRSFLSLSLSLFSLSLIHNTHTHTHTLHALPYTFNSLQRGSLKVSKAALMGSLDFSSEYSSTADVASDDEDEGTEGEERREENKGGVGGGEKTCIQRQTSRDEN